ncbi:MAG: hypothetical protein JSV95_04590 [Gemmatimonadota bacterium]|jgi:hypothetical protein|nr:MAG: hypothetical protein JSV95_04590 [Gemmatimonadota bacterium]
MSARQERTAKTFTFIHRSLPTGWEEDLASILSERIAEIRLGSGRDGQESVFRSEQNPARPFD